MISWEKEAMLKIKNKTMIDKIVFCIIIIFDWKKACKDNAGFSEINQRIKTNYRQGVKPTGKSVG